LEEVSYFGQYISQCIRKKGLQSLSVNIQIIEPPEQIKEQFQERVIDRLVQVFNACSTTLTLEELKLDVDLGTNQLEKLIKAIHPVRSLKKLSLFRISSEIGGFQALSELILQGKILELELSLNITRYWRPLAHSMKLEGGLCVGSPGMFHDSRMSKLGEVVFDKTVQDDGHDKVSSRNLGVFTNDWSSELSQLISDNEELEIYNEDYYHLETGMDVFPLPMCNQHGGAASGFCCVFSALKDPRCSLQSFHLNRCLLSRQAEYLCCLSEVISANKTLTKLKIDNFMPSASDKSKNIQYVVPIFMAMSQNQTLKELNLSELENVTINSLIFKTICHYLSKNTTLRYLDLSGWKFDLILDEDTEKSAQQLIQTTKISKLNLSECDFNFRLRGEDTFFGAEALRIFLKMKQTKFINNSIQELNLDSVSVQINGRPIRTRDIVSMLMFQSLKELDISEKPEPYLHTQSDGEPVENVIKDDALIEFFKILKENLPNVEVLRMVNWKLDLEKTHHTFTSLKQNLKTLTKLETVSLNNFDFEKGQNGGPQFLKCLIKYLPNLRYLSILRSKWNKHQASILVKALKYKIRTGEITLYTKHMKTNEDLEGHEEFLYLLNRTKTLTYSYDSLRGVLDIKPNKQKPILIRLKSKLESKMSG